MKSALDDFIHTFNQREEGQGVYIGGGVLLIILILLLVGAFPAWPYSASWGYGPSGLLGVLVVVLVVLLLMGRV